MTDITDDCTFEIVKGLGHTFKELIITTPATADAADEIDYDISKMGADTLLGVDVYRTTSEGVVVTGDDPTTSISSTTITIAIGGSTDNKKRTFRVLCE